MTEQESVAIMLNWGIAGTGEIARAFALALHHAENCCAYGVAGRNPERTRAFAFDHKIEHHFDSYEEMFRDPGVDIVYVCSPHPFHAELACRALEAGKHVLCEKPMAMSMDELHGMYAAAKANNRLLLEGYMYRCHPQTEALVKLIADGTVGRIRAVEAGFCFACKFDPSHRLFSPELGGGAVWDVGGYPLSMANLIAAAANKNALLSPVKLDAVGILAENGVDLQSSAIAVYPNEIIARMTAGCDVNQDNTLRIYGTRGRITVFDPWVCDRRNPPLGRILVEVSGEEPETICVPARKTSFAYEAEYFASLVAEGKTDAEFPVMSASESFLQNHLLQCWVNKIGAVGSVKQGEFTFAV